MEQIRWGEIREHDSLAKEYSKKEVAESYLDKRFQSAIGRVLHEHQITFLNQLIQAYEVKRVLEIACGPARVTAEINGITSGVAVDFNESMLKVACRRLNALGQMQKWELRQADAFRLDLNEKFDLVFSFRFIRHFMRQDREQLYEVVKRHLRPNGIFAFDVVNKEVSYPARLKAGIEKFKIYDKLFEKNEFIQEMQENGFEVFHLEPVQVQYNLQYLIQIYLAPRSYKIAYYLIKWIEQHLRAKPMEWIAVCRLK